MNKHILFLIDHLANPGKYTQAELLANRRSAAAAAWGRTDNRAYRAYRAARSAGNAAYWVDQYFKITDEDKQNYIDALGE